MKMTREKNRIVIDFETESNETDRIIAMLKDREETRRRAAERMRAAGWTASAAVDDIRADEIHQILIRIDQILNRR